MPASIVTFGGVMRSNLSLNKHQGNLWIQLGRLGDIINILPLVKDDTTNGKRPSLMVAKEYASLLEGVSYCDPVIWDGDFADLAGAFASVSSRYSNIRVTQVYGRNHNELRSTHSFAVESWRKVGHQGEYGKLPLVFDLRSPSREAALVSQFGSKKPIILVAPRGLSSPFRYSDRMMSVIRSRFSKHCHIVDLSLVKAHRFYDFLGLYDVAKCLISIDTGHLHLARGSNVPVVALATDSPSLWHGCPMLKGQILRVTYGEYDQSENLILSAIESRLQTPGNPIKFPAAESKSRKIFHVWSDYVRDGADRARHNMAALTWKTEYSKSQWVGCPIQKSDLKRTSKSAFNDARELPFIKDLIEFAVRQAKPEDIIVLTNDDVCFSSDLTHEILKVSSKRPAWANRWDFSSLPKILRPEEIKKGRWCCGTDLFAFTARWWAAHNHLFPDMVLACEAWDWVMRELISDHGGFEIHAALYHQYHNSFWFRGNNRRENLGNRHNHLLAKQWLDDRKRDLRELKDVV